MSNQRNPTDPFAQAHDIPEEKAPVQVGGPITTSEVGLQALADLQELNHHLLAHARRQAVPPVHRPLDFDASRLSYRVDLSDARAALGFGIYNSYACRMYVGIGGATARAGTGAIEVPGKALLVLPLFVQDVEVAADPTDLATLAAAGTSTVTAHLLTFEQVPAPFLAALP